MTGFFKSFIDSIREDFGHPASLMKLLDEYPEIRVDLKEPAPCIDTSSLPLWHELGSFPILDWPRRDRGVLVGWKSSGNYYESFQIERSEYAQIGQRSVEENWTCDITDVHGFSSSKSTLRDFSNTDEMVEADCRNLVNELSIDKLNENLSHQEIRIIHSHSTSDYFARYLWDGRLWLINSGGSRHFASAKYLARRLKKQVNLTGKLYTYSLNKDAIVSLQRDFEMFVIADKACIANAFFNAMQAFKATWLWHYLPRPYEEMKVILLPRSEPRSVRVANVMRGAGILDFGAYLLALVERQ